MKRLKIAITASLALVSTLFSSCEFLIPDSGSLKNDQTIYSTEADTYRAVLCIYAQLSQQRLYGINVPIMYGYNNDIEFGQANSGTDNTRRGIWDYSFNQNNEELVTWNLLYKAINIANECVYGIEHSSLFDARPVKPTMYRQLYGEAKALRAMLYFDLVRCWGDVPFRTTPTLPSDNFYPPVSDRLAILDSLISDLRSVEPHMFYASEIPQSVERMNRGAVQGLIARMALFAGGYHLRPDYNNPAASGAIVREEDPNSPYYYKKYYTIARDYAEKLIFSNKHSVAKSNFKTVFDNQCKKISPSGDDIVFEIPFAVSHNGSVGVIIGHRIEGSTNIPWGKSDGWYYATIPYHLSFDVKDERRDVTCAPYNWDWNNDKGYIEQKIKPWRNIYIGKWSKMWMKDPQGPNVQYNSGINFPYLRYSDVLLMFAEAENELNNAPTSAAKEALKEVRNRAFAPADRPSKVVAYVDALGSKEQFFDALVNERAWEFGGENIRKYDLIRWNKLYEKIHQMKQTIQTMSGDPQYAQNLYWKTLPDGTLDIIVDPAITSTPAGYTAQGWAKAVSGNDINNFFNSFKPAYVDIDPILYILPLHKDVIADSQGTLKNYYGLGLR